MQRDRFIKAVSKNITKDVATVFLRDQTTP